MIASASRLTWRRFHRAISRNWQGEVLMLGLAGMEICWFTPLFLSVTRSIWSYAPLLVAFVLWLMVWGMIRLSFYLSERQISSPAYELSVVATVVLSSLVVIRFYVYTNWGFLDFSWLGSMAQAISNVIVSGVSDEVIILGTMIWLWWRAISISQREHSFQGIAYEFRRNVLFLIAATLLLSYLAGVEINVFIAPFFFFGLLSVALARIKDKSRVSGGIERPFGIRWLAVLVVAIILVLALTWVVNPLYSVHAWRSLFRWLNPVFDTIGRVVSWLLVKLLQLLGPAMEWIIRQISSVLGSATLGQQDDGVLEEVMGQLREGAGEYAGPPAWATILARYVCPATGIALLLLGIVAWLERRNRWRARLVGEEREGLWQDGSSDVQALGLWSALRERIRSIAEAPFGGRGRRLYAAVSVRLIYANLVRLAERHGFPRAPAVTPREYLPDLLQAFPEHDREITQITEAYIRVHYGEALSSPAELDEIQMCWRALRVATLSAAGRGA